MMMQRTTKLPLAKAIRTQARSFGLSSPLVTTDQAHTLFEDASARVKFVDASWYLDKNRNAKQEFENESLPGAVFFDIEANADKTVDLPHMLPKAEDFSKTMDQLGISNEDIVVIYGGKHCFSPSRCWWTFKFFGHDNVHVLNGGITKWKSEKRPIDGGKFSPVPSQSSTYISSPNRNLVVDWKQVLEKIGSTTQIIDARGPGRFCAKEPEPRPGMRGGHMPGAINVPFSKLVNPQDYSEFKSVDEIKQAFEEANVKIDGFSPVITTCGSGVTAAVLTFGLNILGKPLEKAPVYDGSWSEWGMRNDLPLEV